MRCHRGHEELPCPTSLHPDARSPNYITSNLHTRAHKHAHYTTTPHYTTQHKATENARMREHLTHVSALGNSSARFPRFVGPDTCVKIQCTITVIALRHAALCGMVRLNLRRSNSPRSSMAGQQGNVSRWITASSHRKAWAVLSVSVCPSIRLSTCVCVCAWVLTRRRS